MNEYLLASSLLPDNTLVNVLLLLLGVGMVLKGADWLTEGAVSIAGKAGVSQTVIGLTIVAMGTSMPELCVSFVSALKGTSDIAIGNVVGSNIFNTLLIVGCSAMVAPVAIMKRTVWRDFPVAIAASVLLCIFAADNEISRGEAAVLLAGFCLFMLFTLKNAKGCTEPDAGGNAPSRQRTSAASCLLIIGGLACLVAGSNFFVESATFIARQLGVGDAVIGLTIVAGGTSLPELATSVVAAKKGNSGIAIGNVLGSNVFNILMITGLTGTVCPMRITGITPADFAMLIASILLICIFSRTKYTVERWEGTVLTAIFIAYLSYLIATATA